MKFTQINPSVEETSTNFKDNKLIVITRKDLNPAVQAVQSAHAAIDFQHQYPSLAKAWHQTSNYLIFLGSEDETHLSTFLSKAIDRGIKHTVFREPDLNNEITAIALEPTRESRRLCSNLPLILKTK